MKSKNLYIAIIVAVIVTFALTRLWDHMNRSKVDNDIPRAQEEHGDRDDQTGQETVKISSLEREEFGIRIGTAGPGNLQIHRDLPGEIAIDPDRLAHIVPRFPGLVKEVRKSLGDPVKRREVLAIVESNESLVPYEVRSLINGKVIEVHLTKGEVISDLDHAFVIADLSHVWANLSVYQKDLPYVSLGQSVEIDAGPVIPQSTGTISYISPILDEHTRTATARVILPNPDGRWRPGLFVTGRVVVDEIEIPILIPKTALQTIDGQASIFVRADGGLRLQPVRIGRTNETGVEIHAGLRPGQEYVTEGGFTLKAQLAKGSFGEGHAH